MDWGMILAIAGFGLGVMGISGLDQFKPHGSWVFFAGLVVTVAGLVPAVRKVKRSAGVLSEQFTGPYPLLIIASMAKNQDVPIRNDLGEFSSWLRHRAIEGKIQLLGELGSSKTLTLIPPDYLKTHWIELNAAVNFRDDNVVAHTYNPRILPSQQDTDDEYFNMHVTREIIPLLAREKQLAVGGAG